MKSLKFVLGLEAASLHHRDKLQNVGIARWKRIRLNFPVPQIAQCFSFMQTEASSSFHSTPHAGEIMKSNNLKAGSEEPSTAETVTGFSTAIGSIQPTTHVEMIKEYFDVSKSTAYKMIENNSRLENCDVHVLARNMNTLQVNNVSPAEVRDHMLLLYRCPLTAEHDVAFMKEMRLKNLTAGHLARFLRLFKAKVELIKKLGLLPEQYDPLEPLAPLGIPDQVLENVKFHDNINRLTLEQLHWKLKSAYLSWRLDCSEEQINKIHQTYGLARKSMRLQEEVIDQLTNKWNIDIVKIRQNGYLLSCSPVNMALIDSKVKNIAGVDVREYALLTPRIFSIPYHHLLEFNNIFSKLTIPTASVKALPRICTLHPNTVKERINILKRYPEFSALQSHPRMVHLIYYHKKVISRLDLLQQGKKTNQVPSLNKLSGTAKIFNKYMAVGNIRENRKDVVTCLSQDLNVKPTVIRNCLHHHCWGPQSTVVNVQRNLSVLREEGFTKNQLMAGLDVVLYPPDLIKDQLNQLPHRPQVQPFSKIKSQVNVLQHLLYFVEKKASLTSRG